MRHEWLEENWRSWHCKNCGAWVHGSHTSFTTDEQNPPPEPDTLVYEGPFVEGQGMTCGERLNWAIVERIMTS
jgi:hypothetical protein